MREFHQVVQIFRKHLSAYKFKVRRLKLAPKFYGTCEKKEGGVFFISISNTLNEDLAIHILIHELAHMLTWDEPGDLHNTEWGKAYSKVYRMFVSKYIHEEK